MAQPPTANVMKASQPAPQVSVIIPTFRRAALLGEALDSVFAQTFKDFEIIVVEDGPRAAGEILKRHTDRARYVWQPNQGAAAARNTGARLASGQWLAFLDDDDLWRPEKLERQLLFAGRHPQIGVIHTDHYLLEDGILRLGPRFVPRERVPSGWVGKALFDGNFVVTSSALVRKAEFERSGGFDPQFPPVEDYDLWLRLSRQCQVGFLNEPLTVYRNHDSGMSNDPLTVHLKGASVLEGFVARTPAVWSEYGSLAVRHRLWGIYSNSAIEHLMNGLHRDARRLFIAAWRWKPWSLSTLVCASACVTGPLGTRVIKMLDPAFPQVGPLIMRRAGQSEGPLAHSKMIGPMLPAKTMREPVNEAQGIDLERNAGVHAERHTRVAQGASKADITM